MDAGHGRGFRRAGQIVRPLESVGCYVPGGRYPLPSTLLMTVTAGYRRGGRRTGCGVLAEAGRETLAAARLAGSYRSSTASAERRLWRQWHTWTESVTRVNKAIVGPGTYSLPANSRRWCSQECGIDIAVSGPTEIVVTSEKGDAAGIAADLVAQAEHDPGDAGGADYNECEAGGGGKGGSEAPRAKVCGALASRLPDSALERYL